MKTTPQILEEFDKKFVNNSEEKHILNQSVQTIKDFIEQSLTQILDELPDDESLEDESNGRYNRETELRAKINKLKGDI
jgi:hypothetical protein